MYRRAKPNELCSVGARVARQYVYACIGQSLTNYMYSVEPGLARQYVCMLHIIYACMQRIELLTKSRRLEQDGIATAQKKATADQSQSKTHQRVWLRMQDFIHVL